MIPPTSIDGSDITGATIDDTDVQEITVDGDVVFSAGLNLNDFVAPGNLVSYYPFSGNVNDETRTGGFLDNNNISVSDSTDYSYTVNDIIFDNSDGVLDYGSNTACIEFDGSDDSLFFNPDYIDSVTRDVTVTMWVKLLASDLQIFMSADADRALLGFDASNGGYFVAYKKTGNYPSSAQAFSNDTTINQWRHLAYTATGSSSTVNWELYLDGQSVATLTGDDGTANITLVLGGENGGGGTSPTQGNFYEGKMDDMRVYDTILSSSQIDQIYQNTKP